MTLLERVAPPAPDGPPQGLSTVTRAWQGRTVVCVASGPSLTPGQIDLARRITDAQGCAPLFAVVNDNYRLAPDAALLYFADPKWWNWHKDKAEFKSFAGQKCTIWVGGQWKNDPGAHVLRQMGQQGLSLDPGGVCTGSNTGHQLLNIVALSGAARVLLLGYDARRGDDGRRHWFGDHPDRTQPPYEALVGNFRTLRGPLDELGVEVLNCTPGSAIDCFPKVDLASLVPDTPAAAIPA